MKFYFLRTTFWIFRRISSIKGNNCRRITKGILTLHVHLVIKQASCGQMRLPLHKRRG